MSSTRLVVLSALLASLGCSENSTQPEILSDGTANIGLPGNLVQRVTVSPSSPTTGEIITVRSVIKNEGATPNSVESRICSLDYDGSLRLSAAAVAKCAAISQHHDLAPGDSVVVVDLMGVASPAGQYRLEVRHALNPETWATVDVEVRAP